MIIVNLASSITTFVNTTLRLVTLTLSLLNQSRGSLLNQSRGSLLYQSRGSSLNQYRRSDCGNVMEDDGWC